MNEQIKIGYLLRENCYVRETFARFINGAEKFINELPLHDCQLISDALTEHEDFYLYVIRYRQLETRKVITEKFRQMRP